MTREEAIEHIWDLSRAVAGEFCCDTKEMHDLEARTEEAIAALGVIEV